MEEFCFVAGKPHIFLALPQGQNVHPGSVRAAFRFATRQHRIQVTERRCSLLTLCFNMLYAEMLNRRAELGLTHFAMLHADIEPEPWWLDSLLVEMETHDADLISAVVPLKEHTGITSTGIEDPENPFTAAIRLTLRQVYALPVTFGAAECGYPERALLINSGCWVMRLDRPWLEDVAFTVNDRIRKCDDGMFRAEVEPEDWHLSRFLHRRGARVMATRAVALTHHGDSMFPNYPQWGRECESQAN